MTEARANEIFRTKYPEGEICRKHSTSAENKYWVTFKPEGKVYYYSGTSYQQVLGKLGFPIAYKHNIETAKAEVARYTKQLEDLHDGIHGPFFNLFGNKTDEEAMADDIAFATEQLNQWKEELRHLTEDCFTE